MLIPLTISGVTHHMVVLNSAIYFGTLLLFSSSFAFNIEVTHPSVKSGKVKSLFGFSVAGHQKQNNERGYSFICLFLIMR